MKTVEESKPLSNVRLPRGPKHQTRPYWKRLIYNQATNFRRTSITIRSYQDAKTFLEIVVCQWPNLKLLATMGIIKASTAKAKSIVT